MSNSAINIFNHHAMATLFQVRIAGEEAAYAAQASRVLFDLVDRLESLLSRFRENSEISQISGLAPGESLRLSESTFACLEIAKEMEPVTRGAFSIAVPSLRTQSTLPKWTLDRAEFSIRCDEGRLEFDLGAIGKGFALDRMAEELSDWDCSSFLLVAGGSSILAGAAPPGTRGWSSGLGDDNAEKRFWLTNCSLSGSGVAVKGEHIIDPRTASPAQHRARVWALTPTAAVSDALSTACMVLSESEISEILTDKAEWLVLLQDRTEWRHYGSGKLPLLATGG
jgi:thiamine biosynthesis lipoprotein